MARVRGEPIPLQVNKRYSTFQLYAEIYNRQLAPDLALQIAVLEIMSWLRKRFAAFGELPAEMELPTADDYASLPAGAIRSFHADLGHKVDVLYVPEDGIWALRLVEPDQGANQDGPVPRPPVIGRLFETNMALRIVRDRVQVGFRTICSEPEHQTVDCEVFRPVAVRSIANNPLLGLRQVVKLRPEIIPVTTNADFRNLKGLIRARERALPLVVITEPPSAEIAAALHGFEGEELHRALMPASVLESQRARLAIRLLPPKEIRPRQINAQRLAQSLVAFAHVASCADSQLAKLRQCVPDSDLQPGDAVIFYPDSYVEVIPYQEIVCDPEQARRELAEKLKLFPKRRDVDFHDVLFFSDAQIQQSSRRTASLAKQGATVELLQEECNELRTRIRELQEERRDIIQRAAANERLEREFRQAVDRCSELRQQVDQLRDKLAGQASLIADRDRAIAFYQRKAQDAAKFPTTLGQIEEWVRDNLAEDVVLHERAVAELRKAKSPASPTAIADGLYFLAAYARYRRQEIDQAMLELYQIDYLWVPCSVGRATLQVAKRHYEIQVTNQEGIRERRLLDLHLKHGVGTHLIRIYFLWDAEQQKVIVGSLPDHLPIYQKRVRRRSR